MCGREMWRPVYLPKFRANDKFFREEQARLSTGQPFLLVLINEAVLEEPQLLIGSDRLSTRRVIQNPR
jgi:hypothetical protein